MAVDERPTLVVSPMRRKRRPLAQASGRILSSESLHADVREIGSVDCAAPSYRTLVQSQDDGG
jgi:hypothetical protein